MAAPALELIGTVPGVRGDRLACAADGSWAAAERRLVVLAGGERVTAPHRLDGDLRFEAGGAALLAGTHRLELPARTWTARPDPLPAVAGGAGPLEVSAAASDAAGELLVVAAERVAARRGDVPDPGAWLTVVDARSGRAEEELWSGAAPGASAVALEGGVVAAALHGRACLWRDDEPYELEPWGVGTLVLGDGGRLLLAAADDGTVWLAPGDGPATAVGAAIAPVLAAAAAAPVVAWARAGEVAVLCDGEPAALPVDGARALALDPPGTRLLALDRDATLHLAAIRRPGRRSG